MEYDGKSVLVTGGAQGIGMAVSTAFAKAGAQVLFVDTDEEAGFELEGSLNSQGCRTQFRHTDVADEEQVKQLVLHAPQLDILINNAGIGSGGTLTTRSMAEWDRVIAVNLRAPYMLTKYFAPVLARSASGAVVNISSTRALMSEANTEPYSASKGGLLALTHSLAVSLGPNVRVNAISPGWIETADWKKQRARQTPHHSEQDKSQHPAGRVGTPNDIAEACLFLCSERAGFITGTNLVVDGGMTIKMIYEE